MQNISGIETRWKGGSEPFMEYAIVVYPDVEVSTKIVQVRDNFTRQYKQKSSPKAKPHILIAHFQATESMEDTIGRWIHRICGQARSFLVAFNNYSGSPTHSIFLRVQDDALFRDLNNRLKVIDQYLGSNGCSEARFFDRPHLAIANGLDSTTYEAAMFDYSRQSFHEDFLLNSLVLLKRHNQFDEYREATIFSLYPPDTNMQNGVAQQLKQQSI